MKNKVRKWAMNKELIGGQSYLLKELPVARQSTGCLEQSTIGIFVHVVHFVRPSQLLSASLLYLLMNSRLGKE